MNPEVGGLSLSEQAEHIDEYYPAVYPESTRFDAHVTHIPNVNIRTERDVTPKITRPRYRGFMARLINKTRLVAERYRQLQLLQEEQDIDGEELKAVAAQRRDMRGFELLDESVTVSIFPIQEYNLDLLEQSIGPNGLAAVTESNKLVITVDLSSHPSLRRDVEQQTREVINGIFGLDSQESEGLILYQHEATVRRDTLASYLKRTKQQLLEGALKPLRWEMRIRDISARKTSQSPTLPN